MTANVVHHQVQAPVKGQRYGNPANTGLMFRWPGKGRPEDELFFGAYQSTYAYPDPHRTDGRPQGHNVDTQKPTYIHTWRSLDGGVTWESEWHENLQYYEVGGFVNKAYEHPPKECSELPPGGVNFTDPNFALIVRTTLENRPQYNENYDLGDPKTGRRSYFMYSYNRGKTWFGRYWFPNKDVPKGPQNESMLSRTDYIVLGKSNAQFIWVVDPWIDNTLSIHTAKAETWDGGRTWPVDKGMTVVGRPHPPKQYPNTLWGQAMSSTVRTKGGTLLTAVRGVNESKITPGHRNQWIRVFRGKETVDGTRYELDPISSVKEWEDPTSSNPSSMLFLKDGRLAVIYGDRVAPYFLKARISNDEAKTWGPEQILRQGAAWDDIGYPRAALRSDGKVAIGYYWNEDGPLGKGRAAYSGIWCTLWTP